MATSTSVTVLQQQLTKLIDAFAKERGKHKHRGLYLKLSTAGLAALATVLLGWQVEDAPMLATMFKNLALVANALITLFAAYEAFFEPRKLWISETAVLNSLRDVQRDLEIELAGGELTPDRLRFYQDRVNGTLKASLETWLKDKTAGTTP